MYKRGIDRAQVCCEVASLEEQIALEHPVRVIDAFVDGLDMVTMRFRKSKTAQTGCPPYDPRDMLKLYLYGYMNRIRSSRWLMKECRRNIEVMWLMNYLTPDFRTIADFRAFNKTAIKDVFRAFVTILREAKLLGKEHTVDGTKIRANNSKKRSYTPEITTKKIDYIEEQMQKIESYLNDMDDYDEREETLHLDISKEEMPEKLRELKLRAAKYRGYQERFNAGETQILETDPECRTLHSKDGLYPAYNIQTVTETKNHFITNFETTNLNTDQNQLSVMGEVVKKELEQDSVHLIADKGYESRADIEKCLMQGIIPDVGFKYDKEERVYNLDYEEAEIDEKTRRSANPEDISKCLHAGVLPACYENTNIEVEVQGLSQISCFIRHEDGTVTCPMGRRLFKHSELKYGIRYGSQDACRTCPNRCTDSRHVKTVNIGYNTNVVPIVMYGSSKYPVQQIPDNAIISPYNHSLKLKKEKFRVKLTVKRDIARQQIRKEVAEHPFGTVKWYDGGYYFLCRGKEKVSAEIALSFTSYNLRRAINLTTPPGGGVPGILMLLKAKIKGKQ